MKLRSRKAVLLAAAALAAAGGGVGGAIAAGQADGPAAEERQAFLADAAKRLNVTPEQLDGALKAAAKARVDAAAAAGRLTKEQADRIKAGIDSGRPGHLFRGPGHRGHPGHHGPVKGLFESAAKYLGMTAPALFDELRAGKSLADVARAKGKSVDGLKQALVADAKARFDEAVKARKLTADQAKRLLEGLESRVDEIVTRVKPDGPRGFREGFRSGPHHPFPRPNA